jgi:hypothetical protein
MKRRYFNCPMWLFVLVAMLVQSMILTGVEAAQDFGVREWASDSSSNPQSTIRNPQSATAFTYQGELKDAHGLITGAYDLQFTLYSAPTEGEELGRIIHEQVTLTGGVFTVPLDFGRAVTDAWLEIAVRPSGSLEPYQGLSPRQKLMSIPHAMFARQEEWSLVGMPVGIKAAAEDLMTDGANSVAAPAAKPVQGGGTAGRIAKWFDPETIGDSVMIESGGNVGIGTSSPQAKFHSIGSSGVIGLRGQSDSGFAILGESTSNTGVVGRSTTGFGVSGESNNNTGVFGSSNNGLGVVGTTLGGIGVRGFATTGVGVSAKSTSSAALVASSDSGEIIRGLSGATLRFLVTNDGRVGIGTSSPTAKLHAIGSGIGGLRGVSDSSVGVTGVSLSATGVSGISTSGVGVFGHSSSGFGISGSSDSNTGVSGSSPSGVGVIGSSGSGIGVRGLSTSSSGVVGISTTGVGMSGTSDSNIGVSGGSNTSYGVQGASQSSFGVTGFSTSGIGVQGSSQSSIGVLARSQSGDLFKALAGDTERFRIENDGDVFVNGVLVHSSDARLKTNIEPLTNALEKLQQMRGVSYERLDAAAASRQIGVIAQEVETVFPELVAPTADGYKAVAYERLTAVLIEAVKELKAENDRLRAEVHSLTQMVKELKDAMRK